MFQRVAKDESGAAMVEYGLLVGLVDVMTLAFLSQAYSGVAAWVLLHQTFWAVS